MLRHRRIVVSSPMPTIRSISRLALPQQTRCVTDVTYWVSEYREKHFSAVEKEDYCSIQMNCSMTTTLTVPSTTTPRSSTVTTTLFTSTTTTIVVNTTTSSPSSITSPTTTETSTKSAPIPSSTPSTPPPPTATSGTIRKGVKTIIIGKMSSTTTLAALLSSAAPPPSNIQPLPTCPSVESLIISRIFKQIRLWLEDLWILCSLVPVAASDTSSSRLTPSPVLLLSTV